MNGRHISRLAAFFLTIALCLLSACGAPAADKQSADTELASNISADEIAAAIIQQTPVNHMTALEADSLSLHYNFDPSLLDEYAVYMSAVNTSADEIAIFFLHEGADHQVVIRALNERIQMKKQTFQSLPAEYEKLSRALLLSNGRYIALLVCPKVESAYSVLTEHYHFPAMTNAAAKKSAIPAKKRD